MKRDHTSFALPVAIAFALAAVEGCNKPQPQRTLQVSNTGYELDELFTDSRGYTVYRFYDYGDYRYYVVGPNGAQMLPTTKTVAESVTHPDTIYIQTGRVGGDKK